MKSGVFKIRLGDSFHGHDCKSHFEFAHPASWMLSCVLKLLSKQINLRPSAKAFTRQTYPNLHMQRGKRKRKGEIFLVFDRLLLNY